MFDAFRRYFRREKPEFKSLEIFPHKDDYFQRVAAWDWLTSKNIHIYDPNNSRMITLDDWPQLVFLDANGKLTVSEYVNYMATCYKTEIPSELDETIIYQLTSLSELKLIEYSKNQMDIEPKFETPLSSQKDFK